MEGGERGESSPEDFPSRRPSHETTGRICRKDLLVVDGKSMWSREQVGSQSKDPLQEGHLLETAGRIFG